MGVTRIFDAPRVGSPRWIILPYIMPDLYPRWRWYQVKGFVCKIPAQSGKTISGYRYLRYPWQIHHGIYWQIGFKYQLPCCNSDGFFFLQYQQSPPYFFALCNCMVTWLTSFRLHFQIHQKIESRYLGFAGQTQNARPLWVSHEQSTLCGKFTFRAWIETALSI